MKRDDKGECKGCQKPKYFSNKTLELCGDCNYKRNHKGKDRFTVAKEKQNSKPRTYIKHKIKPFKTTGEKDMFLIIWNERLHYCTNCKIWLGDEPKAWMFAHDKPKSTHNEERLNKENVDLHCWDCHSCKDHQGIEAYNKRKDMYLNK
jgi:hypothetical protein